MTRKRFEKDRYLKLMMAEEIINVAEAAVMMPNMRLGPQSTCPPNMKGGWAIRAFPMKHPATPTHAIHPKLSRPKK